MENVSAGQMKDSAAVQETIAIHEGAGEARVHVCTKLQATFRQMVNNPAFSDVAFRRNDGKQVQGCRIPLAGTSEVLKNMFMNGMAESNLSKIELPEISSPVLFSVFEFLYTGTLRDYYPQTWKMACEVINASGFFLLPELDMIIREFMHSQILSVAEDLPKVATLLTEALEVKALCDPMDVSLTAVVKILNSNWSDPTFIKSLSEDAFHYFLVNSKGKSEDVDVLSFREYFRFRQVIRWWVYHSDIGSCGTEELVNFLVPGLERAMTICKIKGNLEVVEIPEENIPSLSDGRDSLQLNEVSRNAAGRLLSNIDYRCIHPLILATVVEPLKISSPQVLAAFRYQAIRRPMIFKSLEWKHGESYRTSEQGFVIHRAGATTGATTGIAVLMVEMSYGLFKWEFIFEEIPEQAFRVGLCSEKPKISGLMHGKQRGGTAANRQGDFTTYAFLKIQKSWIRENSQFRFSFNAFEHTCSLSIDGEYVKDFWKDIPSGIYYPTLEFGSSLKRRVRVELLSGFDHLWRTET